MCFTNLVSRVRGVGVTVFILPGKAGASFADSSLADLMDPFFIWKAGLVRPDSVDSNHILNLPLATHNSVDIP